MRYRRAATIITPAATAKMTILTVAAFPSRLSRYTAARDIGRRSRTAAKMSAASCDSLCGSAGLNPAVTGPRLTLGDSSRFRGEFQNIQARIGAVASSD